MHLIIVSNYYFPETGAAPNRITNLAEGLSEKGNTVDVICPLPNYPQGKIFKNFEGRIFQQEVSNKVSIHRFWILPSISKNPVLRVISMVSFAFSLWLFITQWKKILKANWIIIQNSPLLVSFSAIIFFKKLFRKKIALNISDLWPLTALELGAVKKGRVYDFLEWIERFNYKNSSLILGQSDEILDHVHQIVARPSFLYRNIQPYKAISPAAPVRKTIVYAGLLGVAQGVFNIIEQINFKELGIKLDIYGNGNEKEKIVEFLKNNPDHGVTYRGAVSKRELDTFLPEYYAAIVPLVNRIRGAVPSKIFELMQLQVPILFCGGGEGARLVEQYKVGTTTPPGDYAALQEAILSLKNLSLQEYEAIKNNCRKAADEVFNFEKQISELIKILS